LPYQVTYVTAANTAESSTVRRFPLWLKLAWTAWLLLWAPVYYKQYGAQNFLFFCDLGNFLIAVALWLDSALILSWQTVSLLVFQSLYSFDYLVALFSGRHALGGTEYMFDPAIPLLVRALGLYHLVVPVLLLWGVRRLGYDSRAWRYATLECWILVPINFFWRAGDNVNWARGPGHPQHALPPWLYLIGYLFVVPAVIYLPTHWALGRWSGKTNTG
jgi:hypothetical protein